MINLDQFIADHVINRQQSMFADEIEANKETLRREIENRSVCGEQDQSVLPSLRLFCWLTKIVNNII